MPFGACLLPSGHIRFRLWASAQKQVELILENDTGKKTILTMHSLAEGWFQIETLPLQAKVGTRYHYRLDDGLEVPDPASRFNPQDVHGYSQVIDATAFSWQDDTWQGRPWYEAVIYELHLGTFTNEGTFIAAIQRLDYLVELGITAIELMPVADFSGTRNWGYDGVLLFAPDSSYGTPDELKALVQAAHTRGLMVFLDVVYNHFGPDGNYLHAYAPQFFSENHYTPWGVAINFDGNDSRRVRDFFIHNALYWLEEYHFDGLRLDAVHAIIDDSQPDIVTELAAAVHAKFGKTRQVHLILENDANTASYLQQESIVAQWNDDIHHALHVLLTKECDGYYADYANQPIRHLARCLAEGFAFQGEPSPFRDGQRRGEPSGYLPPSAFINFTQTHDQIGNRAYGERIAMLAPAKPLQIALAVLLLAPSPPMLFMGEEFAAATPFQFFCDFQGELATAVTEGRRREFAGFAQFADSAALARIPDPNDLATFEHCKLDWNCLNEPPHKAWLEYYRQLLTLRHTHIVPHLSGISGGGVFELIGVSGLSVHWCLAEGTQLTLLANLGDESVNGIPPVMGTPVYQSQTNLLEILSTGTLPPWCAAWFIEETQHETA
jgi:1,4-alpha-glucan branching enzyme/maltooligosyltrehalose trehalohydrolase